MKVFDRYAALYDDIYKDKDYSAECDFLESIFLAYAHKPVNSVLDCGCGTGGHALILASRGYSVDALDRSAEMLRVARSKPLAERVTFHNADLRDFSLGKTVDIVLGMFAVMSYMTSNQDLRKAFETARKHLKPGGLFVFDSWFGPAVFSDPPAARLKEVVNGNRRILRYTYAGLDAVTQVAAIRFKTIVIEGGRLIEEFDELHEVRPLFVQEVIHLGELSGLELLETCPFMHLGEPPGTGTWNSCFVLRAR